VDPEIQRALAVPRRALRTDVDMTPVLSRPGGQIALRPIQSAALAELRYLGGLFAPLALGDGKTLVGLLAATVLGKQRPLYLTDASLVKQVTKEAARFGVHFVVVEPAVRSYEMLSHPRHADTVLREVAPDLVVLDEGHRVCPAPGTRSARRDRMVRFLSAHPHIAVVVLSGTILQKPLAAYAWAMCRALGEWSPVPNDATVLLHWGQCADIGAAPSDLDVAWIRPLIKSFGEPDDGGGVRDKTRRRQQKARSALLRRVRTAPGVVIGQPIMCNATLLVRLRRPPVPEVVRKAIEDVRAGVRPDGEAVLDEAEGTRLEGQLAQGFHYYIDWARRGGPDEEWIGARRAWAGIVARELTEKAREGYDSAALVETTIQGQIERHGARGYIERAFEAWKAVRDRKWDEKLQSTMWLDPYLARWAATQARAMGVPTIIWYEYVEMEEALRAEGIDVCYTIPDKAPKRPIALSRRAFGQGAHLADWCWNILLGVAGGDTAFAVTWQLFGRTHRPGQEADLVGFDICVHTPRLLGAWQRVRRDAEQEELSTTVPNLVALATVIEV